MLVRNVLVSVLVEILNQRRAPYYVHLLNQLAISLSSLLHLEPFSFLIKWSTYRNSNHVAYIHIYKSHVSSSHWINTLSSLPNLAVTKV